MEMNMTFIFRKQYVSIYYVLIKDCLTAYSTVFCTMILCEQIQQYIKVVVEHSSRIN